MLCCMFFSSVHAQKQNTMEKRDIYLQETPMLDFSNQQLQTLIEKQGWRRLADKEKILQIYNYIRDSVLFGYNTSDEIKASQVYKDGYGQCNTKATLFMALLRAVGIPCRFHGFTIDKALQKGAITGIWYKLAPKNIIHSWAEVYYNDHWYNMEGLILDKAYLNKLQKQFKHCGVNFCGYGVYTEDLDNPVIDWNENNTYIQRLGINNDYGLFDDPDSFYKVYRQKLNAIKRYLFKKVVRHQMNRNVARIRNAST